MARRSEQLPLGWEALPLDVLREHRSDSEMTDQTTDSLGMTELLDRFYSFHDALLRRIEFSFSAQASTEYARVVVSARDSHLAGEWVNVEFHLNRLVEYRLARHRSDIQVLSDGIRFAAIDEAYFLDFSPWCDEPETIEDFRRSDFFVGASEYRWFITPYTED